MSVIISKRVVAPKLGPTFVEWLKSSGTQYFITDYKPSNNTRVVTKFAWLSGGATVIGARAGQGFILYYDEGNNTHSFMFGTNYSSTKAPGVSGKIVEADMNGPAGVITFDGVTVSLPSASSFSLAYPVYLFAFNDNGNPARLGSIIIYSCQIYDNDILVRDYWPCYDPFGVACLYDKVNRKYLYNAGTGEFEAGGTAAVTPPVEVTISAANTYYENAIAIIGGTAYTAAATGLRVYPGEKIVFRVRGSDIVAGTIRVNGEIVFTTSGDVVEDYEWTVPDNIYRILIELNSPANIVGQITVTTS